MVLTVVYDKDNLTDPAIREKYKGPVKKDWYGRMAPKPAHGTVSLGRHTSSSRIITDAVLSLYDRIVDPDLLVRRIFLVTNHVIEEAETKKTTVIDGNPSAFPDGKNNREKNQEKESASGREGSRETSIAIKPDNGESGAAGSWQQLDLFTDYEVLEAEKEREKAALEKERRLQEAMLEIRRKYGKNAILKGTSLQEGATMRDRNQSIGGHKA